MAEERSGMATAVEQLMDEQPADRRAEQLSMLPSDVAADDAAKQVQRGRPAGSPNRSTSDMVAWILATGEHPLMFLAKTFRQPVAQLASEAQCTLEKAKLMQIDAAKNLAPYVSSKMPIAVEVDARGEVSLVISTVPIGSAGPVLDNAVVIDVEDEENQ